MALHGGGAGRVRAVPESQLCRTTLSSDGMTVALAYHPVDVGGGLRFRNAPHLVRVWDMASGREKQTLDGHVHYVLDMTFSLDGRLLVTADEKKSFVWDASTGKRVSALPEGLRIGASAVGFSRDGRFLATALPGGAIRLWEAASWTARNEYKGHRDRATTLTFAGKPTPFWKPRHDRAGVGHPASARRGFSDPRTRVERPGCPMSVLSLPGILVTEKPLTCGRIPAGKHQRPTGLLRPRRAP
jgi:hypothetical protein